MQLTASSVKHNTDNRVQNSDLRSDLTDHFRRTIPAIHHQPAAKNEISQVLFKSEQECAVLRTLAQCLNEERL